MQSRNSCGPIAGQAEEAWTRRFNTHANKNQTGIRTRPARKFYEVLVGSAWPHVSCRARAARAQYRLQHTVLNSCTQLFCTIALYCVGSLYTRVSTLLTVLITL